jgi:hypothetical protein
MPIGQTAQKPPVITGGKFSGGCMQNETDLRSDWGIGEMMMQIKTFHFHHRLTIPNPSRFVNNISLILIGNYFVLVFHLHLPYNI